jgi:hypothetical protein
MRGSLAITIVLAGAAATASAQPDKAKPAAGAAAVAPMPPTKPPPPKEDMTPPKEIADAAKAMVGSYSCKGNVSEMDGSSKPTTLKMKISTDLGGFYIVVDMMEAKSKDRPQPFMAHMFRTYDAAKKTWTNTMLGNGPGGPLTETTTDAVGTGAAVTWTGNTQMMGQNISEKSHEEPDLKTKTVHLWGEVSMDGKTWMKEYDLSCKK